MAGKKLEVEIRGKVYGQDDVAALGKALGALKSAAEPAKQSMLNLREAAEKLASSQNATTSQLKSSLEILKNLRDNVALGGKEYSELGTAIDKVKNKLNPYSNSLSQATTKVRAHAKAVRDLTVAQQKAAATTAALVDFDRRFNPYLGGGRGQLARRQMRLANQGDPGAAEFMRQMGLYPSGARTSGELNRTLALPAAGQTSYTGPYKPGQTTFNIPGREPLTAGRTFYGTSGLSSSRRNEVARLRAESEALFGRQAGPETMLSGQSSPYPRVDLTGYKNQLHQSRLAIQDFTREQRKAAASNEQMQITADDVVKEINQYGKSSRQTVNSISLQRNELEKISRTLDVNSKAYRTTRRQIELHDKALEKSTRTRGQRGQQISSVVGTTLAAGVFGGPEGFLGGAIGGGLELAGVLGPGAAITGAAIGASLGNLRKLAQESSESAAEIARLNIAIRRLVEVENDAAESSERFAQATGFVQQSAAAANLGVVEATRSLTRLTASITGAGGSLELAGQGFAAINSAVRATGGSTEDAKSAIIALTQVYAKGKVSAEELSNQLAERLPGAVQIFAEASGRTLPQLQDDLKQGLVGLEDVVKFQFELESRYSDSAFEMASSAAAAGARMESAFEQASLSIGMAIAPIGAEFQDLAADIAISTIQIANALGIISRRPFENAEGQVDLTARRFYDLKNAVRDATRAIRLLDEEFTSGFAAQLSVGQADVLPSFRSATQESLLLKELDNIEAKLTEQKNLEGRKQNLATYQILINRLENLNTEGLRQSESIIKRREEYQRRVKALQPLVKEQREQAAILAASGFNEAEEERRRAEIEEKAYASNRKLQEKLYGLSTSNERRIQNARISGEERIRKLREQAYRSYKQLEERLSQQRRRDAQEIEDREIQLQRMREDMAAGPSNDIARQLQQDLLAARRKHEDTIREEDRKALEQEIEIKKALQDIEERLNKSINESRVQTANEIGRLQNKYAEDVNKILMEGTEKRLLIDKKLLDLQVAIEERKSLNTTRAQESKRPFPLGTRTATGFDYGPGLNVDSESRRRMVAIDLSIEKMRKELGLLVAPTKEAAEVIETFTEAQVRSLSVLKDYKPISDQITQQSATRRAQADTGRELEQERAIEMARRSLRDMITRSSEDMADEFARAQAFDVYRSEGRTEGSARRLVGLDEKLESDLSAINESANVLIANDKSAENVQKAYQMQTELINLAKETYKIDTDSVLQQEELNRKKEVQAALDERNAELARGIANSIGNGMGQAMDALLEGTEDWGESLRQIGSTILKDIAKQIMQIMVIKPLVDSMSKGLGNLFGVPNMTGNAMGNAYASNKIVPYAKGGIVKSPTFFRYKNGGIMENGVAGEAGPEGILPLRRGKSGRLGVEASGSGSTVINVNVDATGSKVSGDDPKANQLGRFIAKAVNQELIKQKRAGGLLA